MRANALDKEKPISKPAPGVQRFFVGCALGVEAELHRELGEIRPLLINESAGFLTETWNLETLKGGVQVETSLIAGLQINFWSKLANRVLLRVDSFRAQSVPRLHARFKECELKRFLGERSFQVQVEAQKCKVSNEKTVRRLAAEVWPVQDGAEVSVYVRGFEDVWTVSLDTSGEHLHKRGYRQMVAEAPLRETLAALAVRQILAGIPASELPKICLIDPMAGSGTMLREAFEILRPTREREFSFLKFNGCPKLLKSPQFWANFKNHPFQQVSGIRQFVAVDREPDLKKVLKENLKPCEAQIVIGEYQEQTRKTLGVSEEMRILLITNPPYGERLRKGEQAPADAWQNWSEQFWGWAARLKAERVTMLIPQKQSAFLKSQNPSQVLAVSNGGIPCVLGTVDFRKNR